MAAVKILFYLTSLRLVAPVWVSDCVSKKKEFCFDGIKAFFTKTYTRQRLTIYMVAMVTISGFSSETLNRVA